MCVRQRPLDFWLMKRRQALRRSLSLLQELQDGKPTVISISHYNDLWHRTIEDLTGPDSGIWGRNLFELLSREAPQEDVAEAMRACKRLDEHLQGLVHVTADLAVLARQVDPRALTKHHRKSDWLNSKALALKEALRQMLVLRAESVEALTRAERNSELLYQVEYFGK